MSQIDDAKEFAEITENYKEDSNKKRNSLPALAFPEKCDENDSPNMPTSGQPCQYSLYGPGYSTSTATIKTLPSGIYDIQADNNKVYATPLPKASGLLLELPEMRSDYVIGLVENFWNSEKDYKEGNEFIQGGAIFKAGIMLFGPQGTGKTSTLKIVANKLVERGGTVFYASNHPAIVMGFLSDFSKIENNRKCIVILEDIDSLIYNFGESNYLEMLDSAKTIDNVLFIATTNYPDKLDPRIYNRPGRFSHVVKVGLPGPEAREAFLRAILKNHRDVKEIVGKSSGFSIDHLNSLINSVYREKKVLSEEIERLRKLFKVPKVEEESKIGF